MVAAIASRALPLTAMASTALWKTTMLVVVAGLAGGAASAWWHLRQPLPAPIVVVAPTPATPTAPGPAPPTAPSPPSPAAEPVPSVAPSIPSAPGGNLAAELQLFERGQGALEEKRAAIAVRELRRYLELYPRGRLRVEAQEGLVDALLLSGRPEEALDEIVKVSPATPRVLAAHVDALTELGRCDEAAKVAAKLDATGSSATAFRARCSR